MKRLIVILLVLVGSWSYTAVAQTNDVDAVMAAVRALDSAYNNGNVDTAARYFHPEHSRFEAAGVLIEGGFTRDGLQAALDAGTDFNFTDRHLGVKVYGTTAVATGYLVGTVTEPDGTVIQVMDRFSEIWIKEGNRWLRVHIHSSPLTQPE